MNEKDSKIERLRKETEKLRRENEELKRELNELKKEFDEYKKRHPETVGVKHGKPYSFRASAESERPKKPGARKGLLSSLFCLVCSNLPKSIRITGER